MIRIRDIEIKEKFKEHFETLTDWDTFIDYSLRFLRRSIRVNTLKISVPELKKRLEKDWSLDPIPWCPEGFWIESKAEEKRRDIGNLFEHFLGYVYIQEAASMVPPVVLEPKPGDLVLDMCASPGSKTSQIAAMIQGEGMLIANDYQIDRMKPLTLNLQRMGVSNEVITLMQGQRFKGMEFDKVLVDAPCSGTGAIRKSLKTLLIWNPGMIKRLSLSQKSLIETGFNNLKKGGTMVYSTCSVEPEEDEAVVNFLITKYPDAKLEDINLNIKRGKAFLEYDGTVYNPDVSKCLRIWPQDNDTEGFFVAKIRKI